MKHRILFSLLAATSLVSAEDQSRETIRAQGGTGYKINDLRIFEADQNTLYKEDGQTIPQTRAQGGTGYKINYRVVDTSPNLIRGTLTELDLVNVIKGPVVSLSPFKVFDVDQVITSGTVFVDDLLPQDIQLGDQVKLSGFVDSESLVLVTRIERDQNLADWKLSGLVSNLTAGTFQINQQVVQFAPADLQSCNASLANGEYVEVTATPDPAHLISDPVDTVVSVTCVDRRVMPDEDGAPVIIEGMIDQIGMNSDFYIAGQFINVLPQTTFIRGKAADMQERIKVVVEGTADDTTGDIQADKIRFIEPRINLTVPVEPADFSADQFSVAGVVLNVTPQTQDPDGLLGGLLTTTQIRFRGYDYGDGDLYVSQLTVNGMPDVDESSLTGEVSNIAQPLLHVFGVTIDTSTSAFFDEDGLPITANEFFNQVVLEAEVELENATLNTVTGVLSGGDLSLLGLPENLVTRAQGGTGVRGVGTISGTPDVIFIGSFDSP